ADGVGPEDRPRRERIVFVMREAPVEARLITAKVGVRGEPRSLISTRSQEPGQRGRRRVEGGLPVEIELVGPLAREEGTVRREGPRCRRDRPVESDSFSCPP